MLLDDVYARLKKERLCSSAYEFSVRFLGKSPGYYSVLKARDEQPSIEAVVTLETALMHKASLFSNTHPIFVKARESLFQLSKDVADYRAVRVRSKLSNSLRT